MSPKLQNRTAAFFAVIFLATAAIVEPASGQQTDLMAINQKFQELYAAGNYLAALAEAQKLEAAVKVQFGTNHPNYAIALHTLGQVYIAQGKYPDAEVVIKRALAIEEKALGANHPILADFVTLLAVVLELEGKYADAEGFFRRALAIKEKTLGTDHPDIADILYNLALMSRDQGRYAEAGGLLGRVLSIKERALGGNHLDVATTLIDLAAVRGMEGKYADAERLFRRALAIREAALGANDPNVASVLHSLANSYQMQGKYAEAERIYQRALAIREKALGVNHSDVGATLGSLANLLKNEGKYADAEALYRRALAIMEKALGVNHLDVAATLNNLANLYENEGKYADAEEIFKRTLAIRETALGANHPDVATVLNNLAIVYYDQGKYAEAEGLYRRTLAIREKTLGAGHPDVAATLNNLANVYQAQGKYAEAEGLTQRALAIEEKALGANHPEVAGTLYNLAIEYGSQRKYAEAEGFFKRALAIQEKTLGVGHPNVALTLNALATVYREYGKYAEAEGLYQRALAIRERALGVNHPEVAQTLNNLAMLDIARGNTKNALTYSRRTTSAVIAHATIDASGTGQTVKSDGLIEQRASYFHLHVANLVAATQKVIEPAAALGQEAFEIAQWAGQSSAAAAVQQMSLRFASGGDSRATLVREKQDISAAWRNKDRALIAALSKPEGQQDRAGIQLLRKQIADIEARLTAIAARLEREFPDYAALANPKPLKIDEVLKLLGPDEAMVFFLTGDKESYVFALARDGFAWQPIALGEHALSDKVAAFRRGLDLGALSKTSKAGGKPDLFDLGLAGELYAVLFGSVEPFIKNKRHLLVVPSGPLTALPFHLLITEKPATPVLPVTDKPADYFTSYRNAAWLLKRQAVTVLPSVASLKALRAFAGVDQAPKPMIGFGNPSFAPELPGTTPQPAAKPPVAVMTRAYTDYWQGAGVDREKLSQALPALPDTADELKAVAAKLGAPTSDIHLGKDASETTVKQSRLSDYRIVYFATHGLVAGDIKGFAEPSLALSLPKTPSDLDDGLLTASEVAQLKLNADWVVLSACNTIAGDKPGAEALSGLARAFFYAGARALLVSHWAVDSNAAMLLTTSTFDILKANPSFGRSEALRQAMLAYLNDTSNPKNAYPAYWAPFSVIGEGAARQ